MSYYTIFILWKWTSFELWLVLNRGCVVRRKRLSWPCSPDQDSWLTQQTCIWKTAATLRTSKHFEVEPIYCSERRPTIPTQVLKNLVRKQKTWPWAEHIQRAGKLQKTAVSEQGKKKKKVFHNPGTFWPENQHLAFRCLFPLICLKVVTILQMDISN